MQVFEELFAFCRSFWHLFAVISINQRSFCLVLSLRRGCYLCVLLFVCFGSLFLETVISSRERTKGFYCRMASDSMDDVVFPCRDKNKKSVKVTCSSRFSRASQSPQLVEKQPNSTPDMYYPPRPVMGVGSFIHTHMDIHCCCGD